MPVGPPRVVRGSADTRCRCRGCPSARAERTTQTRQDPRMSPRIVLLHATPVAMQPVQTAFSTLWPEAETINLLDDGLSIDRAREDELSESLLDRFVDFGQYGQRMGAAGILITCSAFGPAIAKLAGTVQVPVLKPNEAMFQAAIMQ